jgi:hypothetical protein
VVGPAVGSGLDTSVGNNDDKRHAWMIGYHNLDGTDVIDSNALTVIHPVAAVMNYHFKNY